MNATDRIAAGITAIACGVGGAAQGWEALPPMLIVGGVCVLVSGVMLWLDAR